MIDLEKLQQAVDFLKSKGAWLEVCPICKSNEGFRYEPVEMQMIGFERKENELHFNNGEIHYVPMFVGTCKHCGFVVQFNLNEMNIK